MNGFLYTDDLFKKIFLNTKNIALVGASPKGASRASWRVMKYLQFNGFNVYPVNPNAAGQKILGEQVFPSLLDVPERVDMVDIFRRSKYVKPIVEHALQINASFIWMQLGVIDEASAQVARSFGKIVIMDRCPAIEIPRLDLK
tara:strand:+ start:17416 stop:17844 length:429 start_codon:yes stop_codon:yes gene_type:complete